MNIIMLNVHNVSFGDYKKLHTVLPHLNCEAGLTEYNLVQLVCCLEAWTARNYQGTKTKVLTLVSLKCCGVILSRSFKQDIPQIFISWKQFCIQSWPKKKTLNSCTGQSCTFRSIWLKLMPIRDAYLFHQWPWILKPSVQYKFRHIYKATILTFSEHSLQKNLPGSCVFNVSNSPPGESHVYCFIDRTHNVN